MMIQQHAPLTSPSLLRLVCDRGVYPLEEGIQKRLRRLHPSFSASKPLPYVKWDLESHNGHLRSDSNQNHIGKSPGTNPPDQATLSSFISTVFFKQSCPLSDVKPREYVRSAAMCILGIFYSHCSRAHSPSVMLSTCLPPLTLAMERFLLMY